MMAKNKEERTALCFKIPPGLVEKKKKKNPRKENREERNKNGERD